MYVQGVRVEGTAQRTDVPQAQESDTFRQSDVLVEAKEHAMQLRRDLHFFAQHNQSPTPTCQSLHAPMPEGTVAKNSRVELVALWVHLPDDVLVPDGLGNVWSYEGSASMSRSIPASPNSGMRSSQFVQIEVLAVPASEFCRWRGTCNICATASPQALQKSWQLRSSENRSKNSKFCVRIVPKKNRLQRARARCSLRKCCMATLSGAVRGGPPTRANAGILSHARSQVHLSYAS